MIIKIEHKKSGNCQCANCGRYQDGMRMHPFTVWHKAETEKRGQNEPVCSPECAEELKRRMEEA